jgi:LuxR family transcriptional regulator, maltose regulon positive regulatory protein
MRAGRRRGSRGVTSWLSGDEADADPVRFWAAFIEAPRAGAPGFGADAAELLAMDGAVSADVTAFVANDAARLPGPAGSAIVVDDFHITAGRGRLGFRRGFRGAFLCRLSSRVQR